MPVLESPPRRENTRVPPPAQPHQNDGELVSRSTLLVLPDPDEIRPLRPIHQRDIDEVVKWHHELHDLRRLALSRAFEIGYRLRCWKDLIPHGKWLCWLKNNVPIPERTVQQYIQLWDRNEAIRAHFKSAESADLEELPPIRDALDFIKKSAPQLKERPQAEHYVSRIRQRRTVDVEAIALSPQRRLTPAAPPVEEPVRPVKISEEEVSQPQRCPTCGRPL